MGLSKTEKFTKQQKRIAELTKAIGHPARVAIIDYLLEKKACVCGEIVDELPLSQATISQHLKELKNVGLIKGDIEGRNTCYCINEKIWKEAQASLQNLFNRYVQNDYCC